MKIVVATITGLGIEDDPFRPDTPALTWQAPEGIPAGATEALIEEYDA